MTPTLAWWWMRTTTLKTLRKKKASVLSFASLLKLTHLPTAKNIAHPPYENQETKLTAAKIKWNKILIIMLMVRTKNINNASSMNMSLLITIALALVIKKGYNLKEKKCNMHQKVTLTSMNKLLQPVVLKTVLIPYLMIQKLCQHNFSQILKMTRWAMKKIILMKIRHLLMILTIIAVNFMSFTYQRQQMQHLWQILQLSHHN